MAARRAAPWRARCTFPFRLTMRSCRARPLSLLRVLCSPFGPDTGHEAAEITYAEADESTARSVSILVRKTRNDETFSKRVRPAERPSPPPGVINCAAASWMLRRMISVVSWPVSSQNGHSARRSTPQRPKRTVQTPYRIHPSPARGHLATSR